jgi:hypothetical protein
LREEGRKEIEGMREGGERRGQRGQRLQVGEVEAGGGWGDHRSGREEARIWYTRAVEATDPAGMGQFK